jgi:hypothetical protein
MEFPRDPPHRAVGRAANKAINVVEGVAHQAMEILDKPLDAAKIPEGPHHIVDNVGDMVADAAKSTIRKVTGA